MAKIEVSENGPGRFQLCLVAGTTEVDDVIVELGHEPNGEFWDGIVELLVVTDVPEYRGRYDPDPEGGAFYAYGEEREVLDGLAERLRAVATDEVRVRQLVRLAGERGFTFYD